MCDGKTFFHVGKCISIKLCYEFSLIRFEFRATLYGVEALVVFGCEKSHFFKDVLQLTSFRARVHHCKNDCFDTVETQKITPCDILDHPHIKVSAPDAMSSGSTCTRVAAVMASDLRCVIKCACTCAGVSDAPPDDCASTKVVTTSLVAPG